jgi:hypothetical protein
MGTDQEISPASSLAAGADRDPVDEPLIRGPGS